MNSTNWGALLPMWLLGAPLLLAIVSLMADGTMHRSRAVAEDRPASLGGTR